MKRDARLGNHARALLATISVCAALAGCGGDGLDRHEVQGKVTFAGKPVQAGQIAFQPAASVGEIAPSGYAKIENGAYHIPRDQGPITGEYQFRVSGFDVSRIRKEGGEVVDVPMLFPEFVTTVTIPCPENQFNIEVPSRSQARG